MSRGLFDLISHSLDDGRVYKGAKRLSFEDEATFAELVNWLENRVIRHWTETERTGLQAYGPEWRGSLHAYLEALGCPHRVTLDAGGADVASRKLCARWLLAYAIGLVYEDKGARPLPLLHGVLRQSACAYAIFPLSSLSHTPSDGDERRGERRVQRAARRRGGCGRCGDER